MDAVGLVMDIEKDVVPTLKKYVKYQICHNDYVTEFKEMQTQLKHRRQDVEKGLHAQLTQPGKIAKEEVKAWLEKADQETVEKVVEDLICKRGCFTSICSSRKLDKRTQSLTEGIFKQGENPATDSNLPLREIGKHPDLLCSVRLLLLPVVGANSFEFSPRELPLQIPAGFSLLLGPVLQLLNSGS
ncbi:hypothetical protein SLEP1_g41107 [Rubroshorea leprosula]|uniref:Uncharacterized protein n=1 Tax=Rubroshorea leprosula TaxID=152421 RepID=A0AAV5L5L7_9ROSI|nr:hypothetical protein SLEP1_g41107 [Rubroshorea leprosula]